MATVDIKRINLILGDNTYRERYIFDFYNNFPTYSFKQDYLTVKVGTLDMLEKDIGKQEFRKIKNSLYLSKTNGFYVYAPKSQFKNYIELIKYVTRYVSRPVATQQNIINHSLNYLMIK